MCLAEWTKRGVKKKGPRRMAKESLRQGQWDVVRDYFFSSTAFLMSAKMASIEPTPLMLTETPSFL